MTQEKRDIIYMQKALELARIAADQNEVPVGAIVVHDPTGEIIGRGFNRREYGRSPLTHAEIVAIHQASKHLGGWRLLNCTLYVTLEPCPMCAGAMVMSRLPRCVYAAADPAQGCCGSVYDLPADPALHGVTRWVYQPDPRAQRLPGSFFGREGAKQDIQD